MSALPENFWETLPLRPEVQLLSRDANGLAAFNKPAGVLSHPNDAKDEPRSLLNAKYDKEAQCFSWKTVDGAPRQLWLLNRLDSATSGVILTASSAKLAAVIREHFANKQVRKIYNAVVFGKPQLKTDVWRDLLAVKRVQGKIRTAMIGNVPSETVFQLVRQSQKNFSTSLIRLEPRTGRSHQLRVQCAKRHLPIIGDQTYGNFGLNRTFAKMNQTKRLFLHSLETSFTYDFAGKACTFKAEAPLPQDFQIIY